MRKLSRERRLAVITASLATSTAGSASIVSRHAQTLSDGAHGFLVGFPLGLSIILLGVSFKYLKLDRSSCPPNSEAS